MTLTGLAACLAVVAVALGAVDSGSRPRDLSPGMTPAAASLADHATHHYLYVFPDQAMYVYDIDHGHRLVQQVSLPGISGIRGVAASPDTHTLYIAYGGDAGTASHGSVIAYDLLTGAVRWRRTYDRGIDSLAVDRTGRVLYVPDGELSTDGVWSVVDAASGAALGQINGGSGPHNTVVGASGRRVYLGGRSASYLDVASTATGRIIKRIGPLHAGLRPFTVDGADRLAFTTGTGVLGFQVSSIRTGKVLYTEGFGPRFGYDPATFAPSAPSHGISLSPNQRQLWVIDAPNDYVHVFDVAGLPSRAPRRIADIRLRHDLTGSEAGCSYDCARDGWLLHSRSGCYVYVGDSGEVISTVTRREVAFLPALRDTRKYVEIDWRAGVPVSTTGRQGLGYVRHGPPAAPPRCR
jgi:DNA-binding beta-propeller fold protein YncE